ncbi:hypothetical protein [Mahella australiensis]|uniref:Uncharacterized protein n=1 Tax=Mahella australiensis (strain DSM 15567 / CIP 107919 / 50-1 BON) TaxID=697281 RepID=F3ZWX3_MAHA5|nr:hypothetical protein [Mahella australiensis]AEE97595.1 hypothetical protein Mahau_2433 [Mahella australiensis 50-1 BON]
MRIENIAKILLTILTILVAAAIVGIIIDMQLDIGLALPLIGVTIILVIIIFWLIYYDTAIGQYLRIASIVAGVALTIVSVSIIWYETVAPAVACDIQTAEIEMSGIKSFGPNNTTADSPAEPFKLGYSIAGGEAYYYVYREIGDQYLLEKLDAEDTVLVYGEQPRLVYQYNYFIVKNKPKAVNVNGVKHKRDAMGNFTIKGVVYEDSEDAIRRDRYEPLLDKVSPKTGETLYIGLPELWIKLQVPGNSVTDNNSQSSAIIP